MDNKEKTYKLILHINDFDKSEILIHKFALILAKNYKVKLLKILNDFYKKPITIESQQFSLEFNEFLQEIYWKLNIAFDNIVNLLYSVFVEYYILDIGDLISESASKKLIAVCDNEIMFKSSENIDAIYNYINTKAIKYFDEWVNNLNIIINLEILSYTPITIEFTLGELASVFNPKLNYNLKEIE